MTNDSDLDQPEIVKSRYARLFGLESPTSDAVRLVKILSVILPAFAASFQISTTFWMIYIAESLGNGDYFAGLTLVGFLVVIQMAIQTALDYPSGAIGDWIGQRFVIASALVCYAFAFWLTSTVVKNTPSPFYVYVVIYILFGLGASQESGAFHAWFDNNYRAVMPHDKDRKMYGVFWGKVGMIWQVASTLVLIPGSWLAYFFGEPWVFQFQAVFAIFLAILVFKLVRDLPGVRDENEKRPDLGEYGTLLKDGFKFLWSSRFVTLLILGEVVMFSTGPVWWNLILFPLYFSYLVTIVAVSSFRTLVFIPQALSNERSGVLAKRFDPKTWIPRFRFLQFTGFVFYLLLAVVVHLFPGADPNTTEFISILVPFTSVPIIEIPIETIVPVALLFILFVALNMFGGIADILTQRVMLDVIPNRIRNSMYSLQPTLVMLVSMPLIAFFGWFIPFTGGFTLSFLICAVISLISTIMIYEAFKHPIPKTEEVIVADKEESEEVIEMEVT
ncbi:MAG: MFS transporter [Candidatus Thorarchaeota archaeon]|nr:MFS transporter [Candidatus Thorarchaeota archaeon]